MMVSDNKKAKPNPAPKKEDAAKSKTTPDAAPAKVEGGEKPDAAPARYSRGEGQKPVTQAYKDNWNAIFGKKKKR